MEDVKQYTAACDKHCLTIFLYDYLCFTLPKHLLDWFVFIDSRGTEHDLSFAGRSWAHVTNVSLGMGKLIFTGEEKDLAEACGFTVWEAGTEKQVPQQICREKELSRKKEGPLLVRKTVTFHELSKGVDIEVANNPTCTEAYIRFQVGACDWLVHMAWMDNHSGGFHGSGHFGVMIVNGKTNEGLYADFGMYHMMLKDGTPHEGDGSNQDYYAVVDADELEKHFDMIRVSKPIKVQFTPEELFADDMIAELWSRWNKRYGSEVVHRKKCHRFGLRGPNHQWTWEIEDEFGRHVREAKPPYNVDGILGWAGFRLKRGAYDHMRDFIERCQATAEAKWEKTKAAYARHRPREAPKNQYSVPSFNCMTFGLCVYEAGANPNNTLKGDLHDKVNPGTVDHPDAHIRPLIAQSHDGGYFYDRQFQGKPVAATGEAQEKVTDIRRDAPKLVTGSEI